MPGGRPPKAGDLVDQFHRSPEAKKRLKWILNAMAGKVSTEEACEALGVCPARYHQLQIDALAGALVGLEAKPGGRPRKRAGKKEEEKMKKRIAHLEKELKIAQVRSEIAITMPELIDRRVKKRWKKKWEGLL